MSSLRLGFERGNLVGDSVFLTKAMIAVQKRKAQAQYGLAIRLR